VRCYAAKFDKCVSLGKQLHGLRWHVGQLARAANLLLAAARATIAAAAAATAQSSAAACAAAESEPTVT
jgi:hypothetical protein